MDPALVNRVLESLAVLEQPSDDGSPAPSAAGAPAAALLRATRDTLGALSAAREAGAESASRSHRTLLHRILEGALRRPVRLAFHSTPFAAEWTDLLLEVVVASDFTVGSLFTARAKTLGDRTLFLQPPGHADERVSWRSAAERILGISRALLALRRQIPGAPVAILSENSLEGALMDLACLVTGTPDIPVPANSPPGQVDYILRHAKAGALFVGSPHMAEIARESIDEGEVAGRVYWLDRSRDGTGGIRPFAEFLEMGSGTEPEEVRTAIESVRATDHATTMYTSGTTGMPNAISFTQAHLVTKRFARAAAWPDLGRGDVFLCYLPLYHTFGRFLEMLGCVFWGSIYAFVEDPSIERLLYSFQWARPTTFISVPKKWLEIAEAAAPVTGEEDPPDPDISRAVIEVTGGRLRRGLSAAGYLPPAVFRRFHRAGIELHSGFGMTEATGGITMTPAGEYREDSIGTALPGIELLVAEDRELLIRGAYVAQPVDADSKSEDGWFATGDIVREIEDGHLVIVDRKKEIFKNLQGETISPRRIERMFGEFDTIARTLVIGDGREYCTLLIVPSEDLCADYADSAAEDPAVLRAPELRELYAAAISTVNRFLAPYERILDFAVLARDFDADAGELTAKGTPRRKRIAEAYNAIIEPMYSRGQATFQLGDLEVVVGHWFFRQSGIPSGELRAVPGGLRIGAAGKTLTVRRVPGTTRVLVGDLEYEPCGPELLLGEILGRARLWLGNRAVRAFAGKEIEHWWRRGRRFEVRTRLALVPARVPGPEGTPEPPSEEDATIDTALLHDLAARVRHPKESVRRTAIAQLRSHLTGRRTELRSLIRDALASALPDPEVRPYALCALLPVLDRGSLSRLLDTFLSDPSFLQRSEARIVAGQELRPDQVNALINRVLKAAYRSPGRPPREVPGLRRLLRFLTIHGVLHPAFFRRVRTLLVKLESEWGADTEAVSFLRELRADLSREFRDRLPKTARPREEWKRIVRFSPEITAAHRSRILHALSGSPILPEASLLFGNGVLVDPSSLAEGAIRVSWLGEGKGRSVFHLQCRVRAEESDPLFECVLKASDSQRPQEVEAELALLIRAADRLEGRPVAKAQGGWYPDSGMWTEEFIPKPTLDVLADRLAKEPGSTTGARLPEIWRYLLAVSTSLAVGFWDRTGGKFALEDPAPRNVILPEHDWQVGGRLVSIAERGPCERVSEVLIGVHMGVVVPLQQRFAGFGLGEEWNVLFSTVLEVLGEERGLELLRAESHLIGDEPLPGDPAGTRVTFGMALARFLSSVRRHGFMPVRLRSAARRYRRWSNLNPHATLEAQSATLDQLAVAYGMDELEGERPGSRLRFLRHTAFRRARPGFTMELDRIIAQAPRTEAESPGHWKREIAALRESFPMDDREQFFLARTLFPHLDPARPALLVREEDTPGGVGADVEVEHRDQRGDVFRIRRPGRPEEVSALYRIFREENFRWLPPTEETDHLLVFDDAGRVLGGIIYRFLGEAFAQIEWLVISHARRSHGLGSVLFMEFLGRMRGRGIRVVSTGFFRPSFFRKFGFGVDPRFAGLVRMLGDESAREEPNEPSPKESSP
ncbi:MAG: hypothetical protein CME07_01910 [Gemmatimonadetes bacterium]|nr:hypothetical protein [Gemmatimonadota bacterium]